MLPTANGFSTVSSSIFICSGVSRNILTKLGYNPILIPNVWLPWFLPVFQHGSSIFLLILWDIWYSANNSFPAQISQSVYIACDQELHLYIVFLKVLCVYWISSNDQVAINFYALPKDVFCGSIFLILFYDRRKLISWNINDCFLEYVSSIRQVISMKNLQCNKKVGGLWHNHMEPEEANTGLKSLNLSEAKFLLLREGQLVFQPGICSLNLIYSEI